MIVCVWGGGGVVWLGRGCLWGGGGGGWKGLWVGVRGCGRAYVGGGGLCDVTIS